MPFFESLGFRLPPRKGTADFLQEITSRKDQQVRSPPHNRRTAAVLPHCASHCPSLYTPPQHDITSRKDQQVRSLLHDTAPRIVLLLYESPQHDLLGLSGVAF